MNKNIHNKCLSLSEKRNMFLGLCIQCPMIENISACVMLKYRDTDIHDKIALSEEIEEDELDKILLLHKQCLYNRENFTGDGNVS
jgi:hypothetical protein